MTDEKLQIVPHDLKAGRDIQKMLSGIFPRTVCLFPETAVRTEEYQDATLIVAAIGYIDDTFPDEINTAPGHTPILLLGTEDKLPAACAAPAATRLVDYLRVPVAKEIFFHRISLLQRLGHFSTSGSQTLPQHDARSNGLTAPHGTRHHAFPLSEAFNDARQNDKELSLLVMSVDNFDDIIIRCGVDFGDYILRQLAMRLTETVRAIDICHRFSDDDFIIILPGADLQHALASAQEIGTACSARPISDTIHTAPVSVAIGVASMRAHQPDSPDNFIFMAEKALFAAKARGRNQICSFSLPESQDNSPQNAPLAFLKHKLERILNKTKSSAISSLALLAENVAGREHKTQINAVSHYLSLLGSHVGLPERHVQTFHNSVTLYNCFRALLHSELLAKPAKLTDDERKIIEDLPFKLTDLTEMFDYLADERRLLRNFNERYDGTGYPAGLKGDEIPLGARMFHIIDAVTAMSADRPFRKKLLPRDIIKELKKEAGRQFDPFLVLQLLTVIEKNKLLDVEREFLIQSRQDIFNSFTQHRP